eukprot:5073396-Ditylum_brightwellii.AAC.1
MEWKRLYCGLYKRFMLYGKDGSKTLEVSNMKKIIGQQQDEEEENWHNSNGTMNGVNIKKNQ